VVTYYSDVLEKTQRYVASCLDGFYTKQCGDLMAQSDSIGWWSDSGSHFKTYQLMWYFLERWPKLPACGNKPVYFNMDCEHHGKGPADAEVAVQKRILRIASKEHVIATLPDVVSAMQSAPPSSITRLYVNFQPPPKFQEPLKTLDANYLSKFNMLLCSSYAWKMEPGPVGQPAQLSSATFSGCAVVASCHPKSKEVETADENDEASTMWRRSYRKEEPEKMTVNVSYLSRKRAHLLKANANVQIVGKRSRTLSEKAQGFLKQMKKSRHRFKETKLLHKEL